MLARRWQYLTDELHTIDKALRKLTKESASTLMEQFGVGPCVAATLLVTTGDTPQRIGKESAFAALCGASPLQASLGKTSRHRLDRGGSREANNALWTVAL
ncbi:transposase [Vibrio tapetis]|uniref:Transposase n=1 Tax=Vibrio tapetis subsp. tapetis TaxID=1671868 RepID=A0A2N8ZI12_9VIBR